MRKNVAGQKVSAVVVSATDGSAITSGVSVTVTGDGGTQGAGGGTATHEGGGEWSYAPTQAETNFDHVMFKFSGTGAVPVGIQVYTNFPQTGDSFARLGAPAGASIAADLAAIEAQTDDIGAAGAGLTALGDARLANLDAAVSTRATPAQVNTECDTALADYNGPTHAELISEVDAVQTDIAALNDFNPATDTVTLGNGTITAAKFAAGAIDAAAVNADVVDEIHDEVVEGAVTMRQAWRLVLAVLTGKSSGHEAGSPVYRDIGDTKNRIAATTDADGNRTAIGTRDGT